MLVITEDAAEMFLLAMGDVNAVQLGRVPSGVRISRKIQPHEASTNYRIEIVFEADGNDVLLNAPHGVQVFISPDAVHHLANQILDGTLDDTGHMLFMLRAA